MKSPEELRAVSQEHFASLQEILSDLSPPFDDVVGAVAAAVTAKIFDGLADVLETMLAGQNPKAIEPPRQQLLRQLIDRNHAIRKAAANGDWERLAEIAGLTDDQDTPTDPPASAGEEGGD